MRALAWVCEQLGLWLVDGVVYDLVDRRIVGSANTEAGARQLAAELYAYMADVDDSLPRALELAAGVV